MAVPALFAERESLLAAVAVEQPLVVTGGTNEMELMTVPPAAERAKMMLEQFSHGSNHVIVR